MKLRGAGSTSRPTRALARRPPSSSDRTAAPSDLPPCTTRSRPTSAAASLLIAGFVLVVSLVGAAFGLVFGYGWRGRSSPSSSRASWRSPRTGSPTRSPWPSAGPSPADPARVPAACTTSSRACASPAGCPAAASTSSTTRPRTPSPPAATRKHAAIAVTTGLLEKMNRVELEGVLAHELSATSRTTTSSCRPSRSPSSAPSPCCPTSRIRMMWWNGGRVRRDGDRNDGNNPLAIFGFVFIILAPLVGQGHAGRGQPPPRGAGRRLRRPDDPLPTRADLGAREAAGRHDGHPLGVQGHRPPVDRAADVGRGRPRASSARFNSLFDTHPPLEERIAALREL